MFNEFIKDLVRHHVLHSDLFQAHRLMPADEAREAEAHEWAKGTRRDIAGERGEACGSTSTHPPMPRL